jgi:predicted nucleic acid-binding protein
MIIVDTNVVAEMMKPSPDHSVVSWLNDQESAALFLTTVTIGEIGYGLEILPQGRRRLHLEQGFERVIAEAFTGRILVFDEEAARHYAFAHWRASQPNMWASFCLAILLYTLSSGSQDRPYQGRDDNFWDASRRL